MVRSYCRISVSHTMPGRNVGGGLQSFLPCASHCMRGLWAVLSWAGSGRSEPGLCFRSTPGVRPASSPGRTLGGAPGVMFQKHQSPSPVTITITMTRTITRTSSLSRDRFRHLGLSVAVTNSESHYHYEKGPPRASSGKDRPESAREMKVGGPRDTTEIENVRQ